jgi:hypothetical protein
MLPVIINWRISPLAIPARDTLCIGTTGTNARMRSSSMLAVIELSQRVILFGGRKRIGK